MVTSISTSWPSRLKPPRLSWLQTSGVAVGNATVGTAAVVATLVGAATVVGLATGVVALGEGLALGLKVAEGSPVWVGVGEGGV